MTRLRLSNHIICVVFIFLYHHSIGCVGVRLNLLVDTESSRSNTKSLYILMQEVYRHAKQTEQSTIVMHTGDGKQPHTLCSLVNQWQQKKYQTSNDETHSSSYTSYYHCCTVNDWLCSGIFCAQNRTVSE